ncbi:MAG: small nuclear ribonucleoprotein [Candidatus Heimdallarchaeota archaeon]|jgi:small nuclear ribonucleoprotein|nr:small nuclear ribonucleoprotein [Candidatus Heimdallarchaeota archaeon]
MSSTNKPMDLLNQSREKRVLIRLRGNRRMRGILKSYDIHLNLTLTDAEEIGDEGSNKLGEVIVRGDNVIMVSPPPQ